MNRRQNLQTVAWFWDLMNRELLELNPPYQRRSVWSNSYKEYFIDTVLLNYPAPAIFVYEEIHDSGLTKYSIVDGKQRLTTIFEFIQDLFPISDSATVTDLRGRYFSELDPADKNKVWAYTFSVEYLPTAEEGVINNIFDRINRNVAKLSAQELRHAKFSGEFITQLETVSEWTFETLPNGFPQIAGQSIKQMKDIEFISQILLLIEDGPQGYSSNELDIAFSDREDEWLESISVIREFRSAINRINSILEIDDDASLQRSRLRNQADFYTLVGVVKRISDENIEITNNQIYERLEEFNNIISSEEQREAEGNEAINQYYGFARAASNSTRARRERENILFNFVIS
ncbi:DUF262 domain-containing protein [Flavobacteriaceae bacterium TP-CH-4]|uniref:DUF262 domain-containing protein n=1 Tax=Pelagihabitans pacificus TaxID=2696054 RepID=A0A967ATM6_9FLAO|nr:DUF262 domain-containing protein [Pelagihabitans pacificus]NHF60171.1 DUF262 domain-containing protein [Pelagihabitans pacificus]